MARPDKYKTNVEPYLEDIKQMCLTMSEAQIAETLGVSISAFKRYKARSERLRASLKKGRQDLVMELKGFEEDYSNATAGVMVKRPWAVVRVSGI